MNQNNNNSTIKSLKDFIKEESLKKGGEIILLSLDRLAETAKKRIDELRRFSNDSIIQLLKMAWNFEEKYQENYGLEEAIRWFKENYPGTNYVACILKKNMSELSELSSSILLFHCFIETEKNKPILDGSLPFRLLKTLSLNDDLKNAFGNKDMIIIK